MGCPTPTGLGLALAIRYVVKSVACTVGVAIINIDVANIRIIAIAIADFFLGNCIFLSFSPLFCYTFQCMRSWYY